MHRIFFQEDLDDCSAATSGATSRSSPEPPHSILKRKLSVGSLGSHSPEGSLGSVSSILRKKCHSQHSSCQVQIIEMLKSYHSSNKNDFPL